MPTEIEASLESYGGWTFRLRPAGRGPGSLMMLLHGWTGNEDSMWVLARNLPDRYVTLAPRALHSAPEGGFSWRIMQPGSWGLPTLDDLRPAAEALLRFVDGWSALAAVDPAEISLMGFSQGAALAYVLLGLFPGRIRTLAALSGFVPEGVEAVLGAGALAGKPVFIAHSRQDDMVPVERARRSAELMRAAGARVTYCESQGGHKVSRECLAGMETFFRQLI